MRKFIAVAATLATTALLAAQASADTSHTNQNGPATSTISMNLTVETGITMTIAGNGGTTVGGSGQTGSVDFGNVSALTGTPDTGARVGLTDGSGSFFVATMDAGIEVTGGGTASLGLQRASGDIGSELAEAAVRFATGDATAWENGSTEGTSVPLNGAGGTNELGATIATGSTTTFQVALFVSDSQGTGTYQNPVLFTATAN